jgi:hypothetical protein
LRNALTDTDKHKDSWWNYNITNCYPRRDATSCSPTSHCSAAALSDKQEVVNPVLIFKHKWQYRKLQFHSPYVQSHGIQGRPYKGNIFYRSELLYTGYDFFHVTTIKKNTFENNDILFQVLTAVKMLIVVFWVVMPCGFAGSYQCFRGTYHLHQHPEDEGNTFHQRIVYLACTHMASSIEKFHATQCFI